MVWIMTRGGPAKFSEVLPTYLYKLAFLAYRFDRAAAVGGLMFIFMAIAAIIYLILYRKK
jgi:multiple sugar transport system permease protein